MADFSSQATDLGAPSMAGTQPVAPVQAQLPPSEVPEAIKSVGNLFINGIDGLAAQEKQDAKTKVLSGVSTQVSALNQARDQGSMQDSEYSARSRALYNQAIAANPQYASEIAGLNTAFQATTAAGDVKTQAEQAAKVRQEQLAQATNQGYIIPASATKTQQDVIIQAAGDATRMKNLLTAQYASDAHAREEGTYNQGVADRNNKQQAFSLITQVAGNQYASLQGELSGLKKDVDSGVISVPDAQAKWQARVGGINQTIGSIAGVNPDLVNAYKPGFQQWLDLGMKQIDPKLRSETDQAAVSSLIAQRELIALHQPGVSDAAAVSKLFPQNAVLGLSEAAIVGPLLTTLGHTPTNGAQSLPGAPQVIGSPNEVQTFQGLRGALAGYNSGKIAPADMPKAQEEGTNSINNVLSQTNKLLDGGGAPPQTYKNVADFFASPEYGKYVTAGHVDPAASQAAKKSMQIGYFPAVTQAVGDKLQGTLTQPADGSPGMKITDALTVTNTGSGVQFGINPAKKLSPDEMQQANNVIKGLQPAVAGLNTMNHIGAHLEGSTDYAKDWESNKWRYLPQIFPNPDKLAVGQVVNGKKYTGGNYRDPDNWMDAK